MLKKKTIKITLIFIACALLLAAAVSLAAVSLRRDGKRNADTQELADAYADNGEESKPVTFLIAGKDGAAGLCDVLMLVRVDMRENKATVLQIPRDTYAEYTDASYKKINGAAASLGGMEGLCSFLSDAFGIGIDGYAAVDMTVLSEAVDILGGVEITLSEPLKYSDPTEGLYIDLPSGKQTLDGKTALHFVRYRAGYTRGDLGRIDAQKLFLAALAKRARGLDALTITRLASTVLPKLDTNISLSDALTLARALSDIPDEDIMLVTPSGEETVAEQSGASYYTLSAPACEELLVSHFGAQNGCFDRNGLFRNEKYDSFVKCYEKYIPYSLYSAQELCEKGININ